MGSLREELELRRKTEIHEIEEVGQENSQPSRGHHRSGGAMSEPYSSRSIGVYPEKISILITEASSTQSLVELLPSYQYNGLYRA